MAPSMRDAPLVGRDHVAGRRGRAADRVADGSFDQDALVGVAAIGGARLVGADEVAFDQVLGRRRTVDLDADQVARDHLRALAVAFDDGARGILDLDAFLGVAQVGLARGVGADQVAADGDVGRRRRRRSSTPIRLAEITLPGPIMVPGAVSATPA